MPGPGRRDFLQAYPPEADQAVVDHEHQVIVATRTTNQASDKQQAVVMLEETIANVGAVPREVSADAGYYSAKAVAEPSVLGTDPFIAPDQTRHGHRPPPAPQRTHPQRSVHQGPDAPQVADQTRSQEVRAAHGNRGAGLRSDQAG